ncbi:hypothetical protein PABG_03675 [Paracoccidioides brasiliensis Pb03]|nr:hypothetical protein PABG_03675 [Paracoccidioides brasiliensis Pb03]
MNAILICGSNVLFDNLTAFAVFEIISYLRWQPEQEIFVVWFEVVSAIVVCRWSDVTSETGLPASIVSNVECFDGQIVGNSVAHSTENPSAGAIAGLFLFIVCFITSILVAKSSDIKAANFWHDNTFLGRFF